METIMTQEKNSQTYALATAAYNEEKIIEKTIQSIAAQTLPPKKWIIVSDGSTDRTDEIVKAYSERYPFIELYRISEDHPRNLTAQVNAINAGFSSLKAMDCDFIGNLDADITLEPDYFESLLKHFAQNPTLGMAGGFIYEEQGGQFESRPSNSISSVAHGVQLFRNECLQLMGGYKPFSWGGADTYSEVFLRMMGWRVESIPGLKAFHHRPTGQGFGSIRYGFRGGLMDHYIGTHPLFEMFRVVRRMRAKPYVVGGLIRLAGFIWGYCSGARLEVSPEYIRFVRREQMHRLRLFLNSRSPVQDKNSCPNQP
jgi:biofilm PGA synthesis N-glycosyltransferase PgaC